MEETYWQQFMATGRVEDYLRFKGISDRDVISKNREEIPEIKTRDYGNSSTIPNHRADWI